jgi:hypothetical protein
VKQSCFLSEHFQRVKQFSIFTFVCCAPRDMNKHVSGPTNILIKKKKNFFDFFNLRKISKHTFRKSLKNETFFVQSYIYII